MSCEKYQELISALIDDEIGKDERLALDRHMAECHDCRREYERLLDMSVKLRDNRLAQMPDDVEAKIRESIRQPAAQETPAMHIWRGTYRIPRPVAWVAAAALMILALNAFIPGKQPEKRLVIPQSQSQTVQTITLTEADIVSLSTEVNQSAVHGRQK